MAFNEKVHNYINEMFKILQFDGIMFFNCVFLGSQYPRRLLDMDNQILF